MLSCLYLISNHLRSLKNMILSSWQAMVFMIRFKIKRRLNAYGTVLEMSDHLIYINRQGSGLSIY
jgi:hypothetical protein